MIAEENIERAEELKEEIEELKGDMNDIQLEFIDDYGDDFADDDIDEFAYNYPSVYCYDQKEFYYDNQDLCDNAFKMMGYELNQFDSIDDALCKAGECGWIEDTFNQLYEGNRLKEYKELQEELESLDE